MVSGRRPETIPQFDRNNIFPPTRKDAEMTGILYFMESDSGKVARILYNGV